MPVGRQPTEVPASDPDASTSPPSAPPNPTDLVTAWAAAWVDLGYTEEGHAFSSSTTFDPVEVAEEVDPISYEATGRESSVSFALAQVTANQPVPRPQRRHLTTGTGIVTFEPPDPRHRGAHGARLAVGRREGAVGVAQVHADRRRRDRPPQGARQGIDPLSFMCEIVAGGPKPFKAIFDATLSGTVVMAGARRPGPAAEARRQEFRCVAHVPRGDLMKLGADDARATTCARFAGMYDFLGVTHRRRRTGRPSTPTRPRRTSTSTHLDDAIGDALVSMAGRGKESGGVVYALLGWLADPGNSAYVAGRLALTGHGGGGALGPRRADVLDGLGLDVLLDVA